MALRVIFLFVNIYCGFAADVYQFSVSRTFAEFECLPFSHWKKKLHGSEGPSKHN